MTRMTSQRPIVVTARIRGRSYTAGTTSGQLLQSIALFKRMPQVEIRRCQASLRASLSRMTEPLFDYSKQPDRVHQDLCTDIMLAVALVVANRGDASWLAGSGVHPGILVHPGEGPIAERGGLSDEELASVGVALPAAVIEPVLAAILDDPAGSA